MLAFRNDEYLWWQVAELTYDTYLDAQSQPHRERIPIGSNRDAL